MNDTLNSNDLFEESRLQDEGAELLIVGIGASAGGIRALKQFFAQVPVDSDMAYVVILHLSPDHDSRLAEVLQTTAAIPVTQVDEPVRVVPNHVYVISPNQSLTMTDGHLALSEMTRIEERRAPVDIFFRTLADSHHSRAVCVVLSGTGANGSMGMKRVKEMGGVAIVQDPREAEYNDMPSNSIATGLVDYVLPVAQIPAKILAYKRRLTSPGLVAGPLEYPATNEQALREIFTQLRVGTGHDFSNYKRATVLRRIERRLNLHELADLSSYAGYMRDHTEEASGLLKDLLISVTNFFRDCESFEALERGIIRSLFEGKTAADQLRIWIAGCATGEEAYTMAMLLSEVSQTLSDPPAIQIFATDIDEEAIAKAREGLYTLNDAADVSAERLGEFFTIEKNGYRVRRELREMVLFARHNLIKDPPFSHVDLVSCRNLLIYLNRSAQERVMQTLHFALNPGGFLFLGSSESIEGSGDLFMTVDKEAHVYQSRAVAARLPLPNPEVSSTPSHGRPALDHTQGVRLLDRLSYADLHQRLVEEYGPPSIVVTEEYDILHISESAGRYLRIRGGEPSHNLLKLIRPELGMELRTALFQAVQNRTSVEAREIPVLIGEQTRFVNLLVRPVLRTEDTARGFILVMFEEMDKDSTAKDAIAPLDRSTDHVDEELIKIKAQLRVTVEQYETQTEELKASNEELQATNEELLSAAEELETSKEELQSVNEELTTVNQELKIKIDELSQTNNDLKNLMNSTQIGTIFLDHLLRVKLFTQDAREVFNLIPADIGRPLLDLTSKLVSENLQADALRVLAGKASVEREVETREGRRYLMRLLPYRSAEDRIDGAVMTFTDLTDRKAAEDRLRISEEHMRLLVESVTDYAIFTVTPEGEIASWNSGAERVFGYTEAEMIGQSADILFTAEDRARGLPQQEMKTAAAEGRAANERFHLRKDGSRFYATGVMTPLREGAVKGFAKIARDLTLQQEQDAIRSSRDQLEVRVRERTGELESSNFSLKEEVRERGAAEARAKGLLSLLVTAQEDERRRVARDLHDQLGQQLTALRLALALVKEECTNDTILSTKVEQVQEMARRVDEDVDFLAWELRPAALDDLGLIVALSNFLQEWSNHFNVASEFHSTGLMNDRLLPEIETCLYRIAQEVLNNVSKHAQASRVDVILERRDHHAVLIIEDDGVGFDTKKPGATTDDGRGLGLIGLSERVGLVGGTLDIESAPNAGTTIFVRAPISFVGEGES
ncbi:MAG: methyltransferase/methylesterase, CheR/CheB with sensor [Acidobacteria bacterium]|nr:methyltransferase/methylesterase, CheR/CheB with sensor [Acidobacteriota bacterium]